MNTSDYTIPVTRRPTGRYRMRMLRYLRRWLPYWIRMSLIGLASGILIAGMCNAANLDRPDAPRPPQVTHAAP